MYFVNGIPLINPAEGWYLRPASKPMSALAKRLQGLTLPGRDGVSVPPMTYDAPTLPLVISCPRGKVELLLAIFNQPGSVLTRADLPGREVAITAVSNDYDQLAPADAIVDLKLALLLAGVFWRDAAETMSPVVDLSSGSGHITHWTGMSARVGDAKLRIHGPAATVTAIDHVTGDGIAWTGTLNASSSLVYDLATMRATITAGSTWTGGADANEGLSLIGDRMRIESMVDLETLTMRGQVDVTLTGAGGASTGALQGKAAYLV